MYVICEKKVSITSNKLKIGRKNLLTIKKRSKKANVTGDWTLNMKRKRKWRNNNKKTFLICMYNENASIWKNSNGLSKEKRLKEQILFATQKWGHQTKRKRKTKKISKVKKFVSCQTCVYVRWQDENNYNNKNAHTHIQSSINACKAA